MKTLLNIKTLCVAFAIMSLVSCKKSDQSNNTQYNTSQYTGTYNGNMQDYEKGITYPHAAILTITQGNNDSEIVIQNNFGGSFGFSTYAIVGSGNSTNIVVPSQPIYMTSTIADTLYGTGSFVNYVLTINYFINTNQYGYYGVTVKKQ